MSKTKMLRMCVACLCTVVIPSVTMGDMSIQVADGGGAYAMVREVEVNEGKSQNTEANKTTTERSTTTTTATTSRTTETTTMTSTETTTTTATTTTMATTTMVTTTETTTTEIVTEVELVDAAEYIDFINPTEAYIQEDYPNDMYSYETYAVAETVYEETFEETYTEAEEYVWNGKVLTRSSGIVPAGETPSGYKETYYNLNMMGCLDLMGYARDGYAVRDDGVKTYNGYVMVASPDLYAYPKGSNVPTTLGMGIVVDFCPAGNLDIAVNW